MLLLDSSTISYCFRGDPLVVSRLQTLSPANIGVPATRINTGVLNGYRTQ